MTPDDEADRLARLAGELAVRVRDDDPQANARWLLAHTSDADRWALLFVLAAALPDDRPWSQLTAWARPRRTVVRTNLKPCGTSAAATRHRVNGEPLCVPCRQAERDRDRSRKRTARATTDEVAA